MQLNPEPVVVQPAVRIIRYTAHEKSQSIASRVLLDWDKAQLSWVTKPFLSFTPHCTPR